MFGPGSRRLDKPLTPGRLPGLTAAVVVAYLVLPANLISDSFCPSVLIELQ